MLPKRSFQDTLFNYLSIRSMYAHFRDDYAAKETFELFEEILKRDFDVQNITVRTDGHFYSVAVQKTDMEETHRLPIEMVDHFKEQMIEQMHNELKEV
ncbi:MAG: hypothetical protein ACRC5C_12185 [Bacilli bacterium]